MSILGGEAESRGLLDYVLIGVAGAVLAAFVGLGVYGTFTGFLQSVDYYRANDVVSFICAIISGGCALALMIELGPKPLNRITLGVVALSAMFGFFAVSKGVPAAVTIAQGRPGSVIFDLVRDEYGGRNCSRRLVGVNPGYEDLLLCPRHSDGPRPAIGMHVQIIGPVSNWGVVREDMRILR